MKFIGFIFSSLWIWLDFVLLVAARGDVIAIAFSHNGSYMNYGNENPRVEITIVEHMKMEDSAWNLH